MVQVAYTCDMYPADEKMNKFPILFICKFLWSRNPSYALGFCSHEHKLPNQHLLDAPASIF